ncbi:MAG: hypothetical protein WA843_02370 [Candidatus Saccharimonadales bacterium]
MSKTPTAIRLSVTKDVGHALSQAKKLYPTLSDPEILKLGLSKIVRESNESHLVVDERDTVRRASSRAVSAAYLADTDEDGYTVEMGKKVRLS